MGEWREKRSEGDQAGQEYEFTSRVQDKPEYQRDTFPQTKKRLKYEIIYTISSRWWH